ncbi:MAG: protein kinase [Clostridiales bacterium]|nr:protein kinase [Clostridiales bacterium]
MEEIIRLQEYEPLWDEWRMDKFLYEGNLSNIYQVKNKENIGVIKVISVPKIQTEVGNGQNLENREQMNNYFREVVSVLENEISKLSILQEIPNILTYKKYQAFERSTEIGFDFILLMDKEQSLLEYVASKKITNKEIVRIVKEVAEILEKAHSEDIIHKDIKVENIFIGKNGEGILGDFALARKIESFQSRSYRKMDNVYTAPEVMSEYDYNVSTDIFALGMVLYLLLNNGEIPISCDRRTFKTEVPKPERAKEKLGSIALKAIAYRARDRYASAKEIYNALCELTEEDFELPVEYIEAEEARKKIQEEKENLQKEEAKKAEEERIRKEEEAKKAEEERIQREEEARKAEEERIRREEEAKKAEEERIRREEEARKAEEERIRREEEARKAEEERIRREEEARKAEEERIRREEEARKAEEERIREEEKRRLELIRIAEEERKREAEERLMKENEDAQSLIANTEICQEGSLHGASIQLNATISDMEKSVYDETDERNKKVIENSSMEKSRQYAIEQAEQKLEKAMEESRMLLGQIEAEDAKPLYEIHANEREYSGFFNFEETVAFEEKKANKDYDQNIDQEPFEQQYIASTNVPTKASKKPLIFIAILLIIIGTGTLLYCNEATRTKIQDTYNKAIEYFENKDVASLSEKDVLAISKREY